MKKQLIYLKELTRLYYVFWNNYSPVFERTRFDEVWDYVSNIFELEEENEVDVLLKDAKDRYKLLKAKHGLIPRSWYRGEGLSDVEKFYAIRCMLVAMAKLKECYEEDEKEKENPKCECEPECPPECTCECMDEQAKELDAEGPVEELPKEPVFTVIAPEEEEAVEEVKEDKAEEEVRISASEKAVMEEVEEQPEQEAEKEEVAGSETTEAEAPKDDSAKSEELIDFSFDADMNFTTVSGDEPAAEDKEEVTAEPASDGEKSIDAEEEKKEDSAESVEKQAIGSFEEMLARADIKIDKEPENKTDEAPKDKLEDSFEDIWKALDPQ